MKDEKLIEELNQLLKGTHMGASVFEDLTMKLTHSEIKAEFDRILKILKTHEYELTKQIQEAGGEAVDSAGLMGTMASMMEKLKNISLLNDGEVIAVALKSMEMGNKALKDFDDSHFTLHAKMQKAIRIMEDDYASMYHTLHRYLIEFK